MGTKEKGEIMEIEKGIPIPYIARVDGMKYPFEKMKVGDSFLVPPETKYETVRYSFYRFIHRKNLNWKFTVRKTPEGHRCWRIK